MILFRHALPTASGIVKFLRACRSTCVCLTSAMAFAGLGCLGMPWAILAALLLLCFAEGAQAKALARDSQAVPKAKEGNSVRQAS
jgi:hypothetical protein